VVIYWRAGETGFRRTDFLICGLLAGLAAGIRLSYAALVVPIIFAILLDPLFLTRTERLKHMLAFAIGLLLSLLPVGILFLMAPRQFIYGNFHYIALNTVYRKNLNFAIDMTLWNKLDYFGRHMYESPEVLLLYLAFIGFVAAGLVRWLRSRDRAVFWLILLQVFTSVFLLSAFTPTPLWLQYFFAPVPFLILGSLYGLSVFFGHLQTLIFKIALAVFILVLLVLHTPRLSEDFNKLARTDQWVPLQIHQYGSAIRAQLRCPEVCKVLTLSPVLPMEAGLQTYPMFAVGSFSWRTAPLLAKDRRDGYRIISYHDLDTFLSLDPPDAILTGTEADYDSFSRDFRDSIDQPFVDYAVRNNYQPVPLPEIFDDMGLEIILWVSASAQR
jgi:hypothetical protein